MNRKELDHIIHCKGYLSAFLYFKFEGGNRMVKDMDNWIEWDASEKELQQARTSGFDTGFVLGALIAGVLSFGVGILVGVFYL